MENRDIPYIAFESSLAREERQQKRLVLIIVILILLLFISNTIWVIAWNQYDYVDTVDIDASQEGDGNNLISGGNLNYESESQDQKSEGEGA